MVLSLVVRVELPNLDGETRYCKVRYKIGSTIKKTDMQYSQPFLDIKRQKERRNDYQFDLQRFLYCKEF